MEINKKLKELREEKNLSQYKISELINVPRYTYANWEQGRSEPSISDLEKICTYFNVSVDYLIGRTDEYDAPVTPIPGLTEKEKRLLKAFMQLSDVAQEKLIEDAEFYANHAGSSTHSATKRA